MLLIFTPTVTAAFIKRYISYHGFPRAIINDKSTLFTSAIWATMYKTLRIKHRLSLAYHLSRGELHASKWCQETKRRSIEGEGKERNLINRVVTAIYIKKRGAPA